MQKVLQKFVKIFNKPIDIYNKIYNNRLKNVKATTKSLMHEVHMAKKIKEKKVNDPNKRSALKNMKYILGVAFNYNKMLIFYLAAFTIVNSVVPFIGVITPKLLIDELTKDVVSVQKIVIYLASFFIAAASLKYLSAHYTGRYQPLLTGTRLTFLAKIERACMTMDFPLTEDPASMNAVSTAFRGIASNYNGVEAMLSKFFLLCSSVIVFFGYSAIIITLNPLVLVYLFVNVLVIYFLSQRARNYRYKRRDDLSQGIRRCQYSSRTMQDFAYGKDIRINNLKPMMTKQYDEDANQYMGVFKKINRKFLFSSMVDVLLLLLREGIVYAYLIYMVVEGNLTIGNFSMYFITIGGFAAWMQQCLDNLSVIRTENVYFNDTLKFIKNDESNDKDGLPVNLQPPYEIEFRNVSFKYPKKEAYVFRNLDLKITAGQRLAIVGVNGAGKTTLVKLLARLYEPTEGEILINGKNINTFNKKSYYKLFSVVFQEIKIFAMSVAENIALDTNFDREKVVDAVKKANLEEKVNSLEYGIDTQMLKNLDPKGVEFSGGENQRLALARALYADGGIIVLDEPTAALDPIAEYNIYKGFNEMVSDKTAIYISHRLASTRFCDVIAFFENGKIAEYGTHDQLMKKEGKYSEMFTVQAQYYKEGAK